LVVNGAGFLAPGGWRRMEKVMGIYGQINVGVVSINIQQINIKISKEGVIKMVVILMPTRKQMKVIV
jgi:hypothetical protein